MLINMRRKEKKKFRNRNNNNKSRDGLMGEGVLHYLLSILSLMIKYDLYLFLLSVVSLNHLSLCSVYQNAKKIPFDMTHIKSKKSKKEG